MTKKSLARALAIAAASALAMVTSADTSALAGVVTANDGDGVDNDAACQVRNPTNTTNPPPNYIPSPGNPGGSLGLPAGGSGCDGISTYDGSAETVDLNSVTLSTSGTKMTATFDADGPIHGADLPDSTHAAFSYKAMFQNSTRQTNTPYIAGTRLKGTPIFGLNEHWQDGFHFYIGFSANMTGTSWTHSAEIGIYDPSPTGGFFFTELGTNNGSGWNDADPTCMPHGTSWNVVYPDPWSVAVTVEGVSRSSNILAVGGCVNDERVKPGDNIINIKGVSTVDLTLVLPVTIPLSLIPGEGDVTSGGGFLETVDYTPGNSRNVGIVGTALQPNRVGLPYSTGFVVGNGIVGEPPASEWRDVRPDPELPGIGGSMPDTLGRGPRCWTYTLGGIFPSNPLWVPNQPCHIDDDVIPGPSGNIDPGLGRGSILPEWWDTAYGFTA